MAHTKSYVHPEHGPGVLLTAAPDRSTLEASIRSRARAMNRGSMAMVPMDSLEAAVPKAFMSEASRTARVGGRVQ